MIPAYKRKARIAGLVSVVTLPAFLWWSGQHPGPSTWEDNPVSGVLGFLAVATSSYACYAYVKAKGRSVVWLYLGPLVLLLLKDHAKDGQPPKHVSEVDWA
jgi:drug/metabolite transporter (DMT)-like permease